MLQALKCWRFSNGFVEDLCRLMIHDWERKEYKQLVTDVGFSVDRWDSRHVVGGELHDHDLAGDLDLDECLWWKSKVKFQGGQKIKETHGSPQTGVTKTRLNFLLNTCYMLLLNWYFVLQSKINNRPKRKQKKVNFHSIDSISWYFITSDLLTYTLHQTDWW